MYILPVAFCRKMKKYSISIINGYVHEKGLRYFANQFVLLVLFCLQSLPMHADLVFSGEKGGFPLVSAERKAVFVTDAADAEVVTTVARCVIQDVKLVTGVTLQLQRTVKAGDLPVFAGTLGSSPVLDALVAAGKVDTTGVTGVWEAYALQRVAQPMEGVEEALVVMGGTPRGTAYGLFEISRRIGVSPYVWWADVAPMPQENLFVSGDRTEVEKPSVKYRGLFINDEDWALYPWAQKTIDKAVNNIGPNTYRQVMELLLRLRANCLWPAKHHKSRAFWSMEENKRQAKQWGIVMSSGDSMLRDNLYEWPRFTNGGGSTEFSFAYNAAQVTDYWAKRAGEARDYEGIYDIGMRGLQDVALIGYEGQDAQLKGLADIIAAQRKIITDSLGGDPTKVPQIYIPYKEALTLYNAGLKIPDDVTLCWVDDNYAYIRQLPTAAEQRRSGGNGIYYHLSYLGNPCSYLWVSTISPSLASYELCKAYENGMREFWMINVGDIKPAEVEFEFCMELAWDVTRWTPEKAWQFSRWWAAKTFGEDLADEMAEVRLEHYRLAAKGKPETLLNVTYSNEEMVERIADYEELSRRVTALEAQVPERLRDAFFQLFSYPILGTAEMNYKLLGARLSYWYAQAGDYIKAMHYSAISRGGYDNIVQMTQQFNQGIANGKWNGIMSMRPAGGGQFELPYSATAEEIGGVRLKGEVQADTQAVIPIESRIQEKHIAAEDYIGSRGDWQLLRNLGVAGNSMAVWPIDYTVYNTTSARMKGPYLEYSVPLEPGKYVFAVRCLPTFPITTANDLVVGFSVNRAAVNTQSIKCQAETSRWSDNVMMGYTEARFNYTATTQKDYSLRVYPMNPALVVSEILYYRTDGEDLQQTDELLVNADFELYQNGTSVMENTDGSIRRGVPYGWKLKGTISGNSYGINKDESISYNDGNICWFKAKPLPTELELYQTIPAAKLEPGIYEVGCMLWNETGKRGSCRMFANDHVQYYSRKEDYDQILKDGEHASFAGYKAGYQSHAILHPMRLVLEVKEGEDLTVGIRTGCISNSGTQTDETGWFKVDHFTVKRLGDVDTSDPDSLTRELIVNHDFEYDSNGELNPAGTTARGLPYGWTMECKGTFPGLNYGLYGNGKGMHGNSYCAFTPSGAQPMPMDFRLYQTIPAEKIKPGTYRISCRFWSEAGLEGQGRLFANEQVQYYGAKGTYLQNLTEGERNSFASYISGAVDGTSMQELSVCVTLTEGEDLTLGVRSGSLKGNGTQATGTDRTGKFRVDYFRIEKVGETQPTGIESILAQPSPMSASSQIVYNLMGQPVAVGAEAMERLPDGIYILNGKKYIRRNTAR